MTGFIFISTSYIFGTLLTANKSLRALNVLAFITVFLSLTLNLLLIPQMKAAGSAIASVTAQGFFALSQVLITQKILSLKLNVPFILKLLLFFVIVVISSWLSYNYISPWGYGFASVCMVSLAASVFLKILTPRGIYRIVKFDE
jgi:O-antigen/teichoic acid export membrane protein